jgi:pimeloyl-ACP methyl ester carboxylesterase
MKVAFKDYLFQLGFVRNLGYMYYGGADLGEMIATAAQITEGDFESWYTEWDKRAQRLLSRADAAFSAGHLISAREGYLRASTYFRMAGFFLHGNRADPRILSESRAAEQTYAKAAKLTGPTWEPVQIPYEGTTLPGYFYKVDDSGKPRPTLVFHGGLDSTLEELFFSGGAAATRRGYNCLTFDGPGQGAPIRDGKLPFRYDWEKVVTPAVDYVLTRPDVDGDKLVLMGMSLGGYLAARAAAFEHRVRGVVFYDGMYDAYEGLLRPSMPKEAIDAFDAGDTVRFEEIIHRQMQGNTILRWLVGQGVWSFGVASFGDCVTEMKKMTMKGIAGEIQCPCLVMEGEGDSYSKPQQIYDELQAPKQLARFTSEDGAENHCQCGALAYKDEVVFNWLDETLKLRGDREA